MRSTFSGSLLLLFVLVTAQTLYAKSTPETLARQATSADASESTSAIAELRELGPAGLETLRQVYADEINRQVANPLLAATPEWQRLSLALDTVSQQKDSYLSGLYWYTDFGQAKAAARAAGKPILSLRLLGKLNEEFSCANSRFFRTILYSNEEIARTLREKFILHWQSVRPAPRVTIDFGDGRKLERTLTGNSIHYILDSNGQVIDALPGLYGPGAFLRSLAKMEEVSKYWGQRPSEGDLRQPYWAYQPDSLRRITLNWALDTERIGGKAPQGFVIRRNPDGTPTALEIASLAITKSVTEASILRAMTAGPEALGAMTDEAAWNKIAQLHIADAQLDERSIELIQRQTQKALFTNASKVGQSKTLTALIEKLQRNIALDTVRNEYLLHTKLYVWLVADHQRSDLNELNKKVYFELFLTPATDPWLGLFSPETYVALESAGIVR
ncbi:MAG: hypothetical protein M3R52_06240 [Acidobacteriota bacterium]|nr:hypothetical protein [Acidobacteriota bacterium]